MTAPVIAWIDAGAGVSGDMLLGALVDAGAPVDLIQSQIDRMGLPIELRVHPVTRAGMRATKVDVLVPDDHHRHRHLPHVLAHLEDLDEPVREAASAVFRRLAEAESRAHGIAVDDVHFHEVGALDSIADVVGVVTGLRLLDVVDIHASSVGVGTGRVVSDHGSIPVPVPAVVELLAGCPVEAGPAEFESATPTGAALLAELASGWGPIPSLVPLATGVGAGSGDPVGHPNVLRIVIGDKVSAGPGPQAWQLDTNVDDMDPRLWPEVQRRLFEVGASDAWLTPILMKKGRPAYTLSVLCSDSTMAGVRAAIFRETTTIGVRETPIGKTALDREAAEVWVDGEIVAVKIARLDGMVVNVSVEWEDVRRAARALGRPAKVVLEQAKARATLGLG